jgi:hypothetical protein
MVIVNEVNSPPLLNPIGDKTASQGVLLTFTATASDTDDPTNTLAFSLVPGAPAGAAIDSATGVFTWIPTEAEAGKTNGVTVRVTDNGLPNLSATRSFNIVVVAPPRILSLSVSGNLFQFSVATFPGKTYRILWTDDLGSGNWTPLGGDVVAQGFLLPITDPIGSERQRFYRALQVN